MTRRTLTPTRKREIAEFNAWRTPQGETVAIEEGDLVTLHDGVKVEYDHIYQIGLGGPNKIKNMQPISPDEHKRKTKRDAKARGKVRRLSGQTKKRKYYWPKGRKFGIQGWRKKFDGTVVKI